LFRAGLILCDLPVYNLSLLPLIQDQEDITKVIALTPSFRIKSALSVGHTTQVTPTGRVVENECIRLRDLPSVQLVIATSDTSIKDRETRVTLTHLRDLPSVQLVIATSDTSIRSGRPRVTLTPIVEMNVSVSCDLPSVQLVITTSDTRIKDQGDPASL
ncbi:hypothetical protein J6590_105146, partial [Homalodisca vitripennis]